MWPQIKEVAPKVLGGIGLVAVGVAIGWFVKPEPPIQEKIKVVEVTKEVVVTHEQVRVEVVHVKDSQVVERWHREKTEERKPDGTVTQKEVEDKNIDTIVHDKENSTQVKVVEVTKEVVVNHDVFIERTPVLKDWHVGALVGVMPRFDSPAETPVLVGVEAERRIIGPVWAGAWVMAGSPISHFAVTNATFGIKAGFEF
jgi:hypothetical protein